MSRREVKRISYHEIKSPIGEVSRWRCHVEVADGSHYSGEGYSKDEARENALDVKRAND